MIGHWTIHHTGLSVHIRCSQADLVDREIRSVEEAATGVGHRVENQAVSTRSSHVIVASKTPSTYATRASSGSDVVSPRSSRSARPADGAGVDEAEFGPVLLEQRRVITDHRCHGEVLVPGKMQQQVGDR